MIVTPHVFMAGCRVLHLRPRSYRDGAHEAFHALSCKKFDLPPVNEIVIEQFGFEPGRELLSRCLARAFRGDRGLWENELQARAVEQIVCQKLGVSAGPSLRTWVDCSREEALEYGLPCGEMHESLGYAKAFLETKQARASADLVLAWVLGAGRMAVS